MKYLEIKTLPDALKSALQAAGYGSKDISYEVADSFENHCYGAGYRAYTCIVNLVTGERKSVQGSFGGENPFERKAADHLGNVSLPAGFVAIIGSVGCKTLLHLVIHPDNITPLLTDMTAGQELSPVQQHILINMSGIKSAYRGDQWNRNGYLKEHGFYWDSPEMVPQIDSLVTAGLLTKNKAGAVGFTTAGKNLAAELKEAADKARWAKMREQSAANNSYVEQSDDPSAQKFIEINQE